MKKALIVLLTILLVGALLSGCGSSEQSNSTKAVSSEHEHIFKPSDCENPQICDCGATKGSALGHSWDAATCTKPKICFVCQATEGEALGHNFVDGVCQTCFEHDPETIVDSPNVWVTTDGRYHGNKKCASLTGESVVSTLSRARQDGFHACTRCYISN